VTVVEAAHARPRWTAQNLKVPALRLGLLVVLLVGWQLIGDDTVRLRMPTVARTVSSWWQLVVRGDLLRRLFDSNAAMIVGYTVALVVGIASGLAMGLVPRIGAIARPYLLALIALPMIGILPLIQAVFGLGLTARVVVVFVVAFIYVTLNAEVGARAASASLREMAHSFGASRWQMLREIVLPQAFPSIMAGTRLGLERAIGGMVLAELFLAGAGIGSLLSFHRNRLDAGAVFAIALTMVLEGVILLALARRIERHVTRGYRR
jgi:ABC-type nitrate/sulfonate/bicarbonate transport system permease component